MQIGREFQGKDAFIPAPKAWAKWLKRENLGEMPSPKWQVKVLVLTTVPPLPPPTPRRPKGGEGGLISNGFLLFLSLIMIPRELSAVVRLSVQAEKPERVGRFIFSTCKEVLKYSKTIRGPCFRRNCGASATLVVLEYLSKQSRWCRLRRATTMLLEHLQQATRNCQETEQGTPTKVTHKDTKAPSYESLS